MIDKDKSYLIDLLTETHSTLKELVAVANLEMPVYTDADAGVSWRIRDILGHIATWDLEAARSLRAYRAGEVYLTPDFDEEEDDFNQQAVAEQRKLSTQELVAEWEQAHEEFKEAVQDIPDDHFPDDLLYPWGDERGTISYLVDYIVEHAVEHRDEIAKAIEEAGKSP
jgi:uncharacterized damage-inducible protein DinB